MEANDLAGVKLLVEYGAGIAPESGERLPLEIAKSKGFHTIVEYLQGLSVHACHCVCVTVLASFSCVSPLELMDKTSRAEVKSAKGHTSQFVSISDTVNHLCLYCAAYIRICH